jgi:hypothetical protein
LPNSTISPYELLPKNDLMSLMSNMESVIHDFLKYTLGYKEDVNYTICALDIIDII